MEKIEFYFDIVCPYSYIASILVEDLARRVNAKVKWKPFLLGAVFKTVVTTPPECASYKETLYCEGLKTTFRVPKDSNKNAS